MNFFFFLILCFHRLCRGSELLGCMSFGVGSLMEPDKVSQNEHIPFPNAFLHGGFPSFSHLACVLSAHPSDHERSGFSSACVNSSDLNIRGWGRRKHFEVSGVVVVACRYWSDNSAVCVALATQTSRIAHVPTLSFYSFPAEIHTAVYHVAHKTFVTLTGVTLEKSGVF